MLYYSKIILELEIEQEVSSNKSVYGCLRINIALSSPVIYSLIYSLTYI